MPFTSLGTVTTGCRGTTLNPRQAEKASDAEQEAGEGWGGRWGEGTGGRGGWKSGKEEKRKGDKEKRS